jgi:hypothetical protein
MPKSARQESAFLNIPYDQQYESLYLAFIAGLCSFGLRPRATIEIPSTRRRLERIIQLIRGCRYSFHDLSRVEIDRSSPATPRFNMPFELGLAVDWALSGNPKHEWFVFESRAHRLEKSLSDLNGTDPHVHEGTAHGVLRGLTNALTRNIHDPSLAELDAIYRGLAKAARELKLEMKGGSLFEARPFRYLNILARKMAEARIPSLRP